MPALPKLVPSARNMPVDECDRPALLLDLERRGQPDDPCPQHHYITLHCEFRRPMIECKARP